VVRSAPGRPFASCPRVTIRRARRWPARCPLGPGVLCRRNPRRARPALHDPSAGSLGIVCSGRCRGLIRHSRACRAARCHSVHGIAPGTTGPGWCAARVGDALLSRGSADGRPAEHDLLQRVQEVLVMDLFCPRRAASRPPRDEVRRSARESGLDGGESPRPVAATAPGAMDLEDARARLVRSFTTTRRSKRPGAGAPCRAVGLDWSRPARYPPAGEAVHLGRLIERLLCSLEPPITTWPRARRMASSSRWKMIAARVARCLKRSGPGGAHSHYHLHELQPLSRERHSARRDAFAAGLPGSGAPTAARLRRSAALYFGSLRKSTIDRSSHLVDAGDRRR